MKQLASTLSIDVPLLCGILRQWPSKILVSLIQKLQVFPNPGVIKRIRQLLGLSNSLSNQVLKAPTNTNKLGIAGNELSLVMTRLGLHCQGEGPLDDKMMISMDEIEGLFAEEEPSLGEIKQAFDVFDQNGDGFIDALELHRVLSSLGLLKDSHNVDLCGRILSGFDHKGCGLIDGHDFVKLMEKCFD